MNEAIENSIDRAGREKVFALAEARGWKRGEPVPVWVWRTILNEIECGMKTNHWPADMAPLIRSRRRKPWLLQQWRWLATILRRGR